MKSCRLRAIDRSGKPHIFKPEDVPVRTFDDTFILANVHNSPNLLLASVVRVMDNLDIGEGDCVCIDGEEYTAQYVRGFQFRSDGGTIIRSNQVTTCTVLSIGTQSVSRIQFRSPTTAFQLQAFLGTYEGKIVCAHDPVPFKAADLRVSAGLTYLSHKLCYGDLVDGYPLQMWHGRPCINSNGYYIEVPSKILIGKEDT